VFRYERSGREPIFVTMGQLVNLVRVPRKNMRRRTWCHEVEHGSIDIQGDLKLETAMPPVNCIAREA
jgi:hypothetical protein